MGVHSPRRAPQPRWSLSQRNLARMTSTRCFGVPSPQKLTRSTSTELAIRSWRIGRIGGWLRVRAGTEGRRRAAEGWLLGSAPGRCRGGAPPFGHTPAQAVLAGGEGREAGPVSTVLNPWRSTRAGREEKMAEAQLLTSPSKNSPVCGIRKLAVNTADVAHPAGGV